MAQREVGGVATLGSRLRFAALAVGGLELLLGLALSCRGCRHGWLADDSLSNVWGTFAILVGIGVLVLPALPLLVSRSRAAWAGQVIPLGFGLLWVALLLTRR